MHGRPCALPPRWACTRVCTSLRLCSRLARTPTVSVSATIKHQASGRELSNMPVIMTASSVAHFYARPWLLRACARHLNFRACVSPWKSLWYQGALTRRKSLCVLVALRRIKCPLVSERKFCKTHTCFGKIPRRRKQKWLPPTRNLS